MDSNTRRLPIKLFLDLGEAMLCAGADIGRVEDSLSRLGASYGAVKTDVFVITSSIVLTLTLDDGRDMTGTRRIVTAADPDFSKLHALNSLCRKCTKESLSPDEMEWELKKICGTTPFRGKLFFGSALAAGSFSVFFGGGIPDGIVAALMGVFVCFLVLYLSPKCPNKMFFLFLASLICGSGIYLLGRPFPFLHTDMIVIGDIMLLVPGIAITTAVRDMIIGDTISGATKLLECLLWAGALAAGFMTSLLLFGGAL